MSDTDNSPEMDPKEEFPLQMDAVKASEPEAGCQGDEERALDFYQKLRRRIRRQLAKRGEKEDKRGPEYDRLVAALALLPDLFHLAVKCLFDKKVPVANKGALVAGVAYVVCPIDLVPDFIFIAGWLDDLIVLTMGLNKFLETGTPAVKEAVERHWAGDRDALDSVKHVLEVGDAAIEFLPNKFIDMVRAMFGDSRRGAGQGAALATATAGTGTGPGATGGPPPVPVRHRE